MNLKDRKDSELESMEKKTADLIGHFTMKYCNCPPKEEQRWREFIEESQKQQSLIQEEITRRLK